MPSIRKTKKEAKKSAIKECAYRNRKGDKPKDKLDYYLFYKLVFTWYPNNKSRFEVYRKNNYKKVVK